MDTSAVDERTAGGRRSEVRRPRLVVAGLVAALVLAGAALYAALLNTDPSVESTALYGEWVKAEEELGNAGLILDAEQGELPSHGPWFTAGHIVLKQGSDTFAAHELISGEATWEVTLESGMGGCPSSVEPVDGQLVLVHGEGEVCDRVTLLDIEEGRLLWQQPLPADLVAEATAGGDASRTSGSAVIHQEWVAVSTTAGGVLLDRETGEPATLQPEAFGAGAENDGRSDVRYGVMDGLLIVSWASDGGATDPGEGGYRLMALDGSLSPRWDWAVASGDSAEHEGGPEFVLRRVLAADPLLVEVSIDGVYQIWRVDPHTGDHQQTVVDTYRDLILPCPERGLTGCLDPAPDGSAVYLLTQNDWVEEGDEDFEDGHGRRSVQNTLVALDTTTGEELWRTEWLPGRLLTPLQVTDGRLLAYQHATLSGVPGLVVEIDRDTGELKPVMALGEDTRYSADEGTLSELTIVGIPGQPPNAAWRDGYFTISGDLGTLVFG